MKHALLPILLLSLTIFALGATDASAQLCGEPLPQFPDTTNGQKGGRDLPTNFGPAGDDDTIIVNAVVVFVDFPDDISDPNIKTWPLVFNPSEHPWQRNVQWDSAHRPPHPSILEDIIDPTIQGPYFPTGKKWSITTYFREMSYGDFNIIGHAVYIQAPKPWRDTNMRPDKFAYSVHPFTRNRPHYAAARETLDSLRSRIARGIYPNVFLNTDRYNKASDFQLFPGRDKHIDLIVLCFRDKGVPDYDGVASLTGPAGSNAISDTNYVVGPGDSAAINFASGGSGVIMQNMKYYPSANSMIGVWHEIGHKLGMWHEYWDGMWSVCNTPTEGFPMMNSTERWRLGWLNYIDVDPLTSLTYDGDTVHICDLAKHRQALRVRLPDTAGRYQYFIFEHHRQADSRFPIVLPGQSLPWYDPTDVPTYDVIDRVKPTPGMFIIYDGKDDYAGRDTDEGILQVVAADGRWHWSQEGNVLAPWSTTQQLRLWKRGEPARKVWGSNPDTNVYNRYNTYKVDREKLDDDSLYWNPALQRYDRHFEYIWAYINPVTGEIGNNGKPRHKGDGCDAWTMDWNRMFSPWSNPNTSGFPPDSASGIAVELVAQTDSTSSLRIYLTNPLAGPPSKPQDLRARKEVGYHLDHHTHHLMWATNLESDVDPVGKAYIWAAGPNPTSEWSLLDSVSGSVGSYYAGDFPDTAIYTWRYRLVVRDTQMLYSVTSDYAQLSNAGGPGGSGKAVAGERSDSRLNVALSAVPNPTSDGVEIGFDLPTDGTATVRIYDPMGRRVAGLLEEYRLPGRHMVRWETDGVPPGTYTCVLLFKDWSYAQQIVVSR